MCIWRGLPCDPSCDAAPSAHRWVPTASLSCDTLGATIALLLAARTEACFTHEGMNAQACVCPYARAQGKAGAIRTELHIAHSPWGIGTDAHAGTDSYM